MVEAVRVNRVQLAVGRAEDGDDAVGLATHGHALAGQQALRPNTQADPLRHVQAIAIAQAGGIPPLVSLARDGTEGQREQAARALGALAHNDNNAVSIAHAGGIPPLVSLARGGTERQREDAAYALCNLAVNDNNKVSIAQAGGIPPLVSLARDGTEGQREEAAAALRNLADNKVSIAQAGWRP